MSFLNKLLTAAKVRRSLRLLLGILLFASSLPLLASAKLHTAPILIVDTEQQLIMLDPQAQSILKTFQFDFPLHQKILHSKDGQFAYLSSPEGWLIQLDLQAHEIRQQRRVAQQTTGIALSVDDRYLMVANSSPCSLIALHAGDFSLIRTLDVKDKNGKASAVAAIYSATARKSFIAVMRDIPELWEMSYDPQAEPIYEGFVHDYKMGEGIALRGPFPPRRTLLEQPLSHFIFDADATHAIGAGENGVLQVINLNIRRKIRELHLSSDSVPDAGLILQRDNNSVLLLPSATQEILYTINLKTWLEQPTIATQIAGFSVEQDPASQDIWLYRATENSTTMPTAKPRNCRQLLGASALSISIHIGIGTPPEQTLMQHCHATTWSNDGKLMLYADTAARPAAIRVYHTASRRLLRSLPLAP
ncbi:cytochrome D1 domain-containing protein [Undibacterium parvum]|nr:cytochrome D1 domain-containing protein [Undibacterium parvum]